MPEQRLERTRAAYRTPVYSTPLTRMYDHHFSTDDLHLSSIYAHWPVPHPIKHQWWCGGKEPCACTEGWKEEQQMRRANGRL